VVLMRIIMARALLGAIVLGSIAPLPARAGDLERGGDVFDDQCSDCHTVTRGGKNGRGPNLFGIVGRQAGTIAGFTYSDANKSSGVVWSAATLDRYLAAPKAAMPGTAMRYKGLPDAADRADVIAFLATLK
jgi:cytochrome c